MHSTLDLLTSVSLILSLCGAAFSAPRPRPEAPGADGSCTPPVIAISSSIKIQLGPFLVSGARSDANPGGGVASWSNQWSVQTTITVGGALELSADVEKVATLGLGLVPSVSISYTTGKATAAITECPANTGSGNNDTITWGLQYYQYSYSMTGTKTYGGYDPMMRDCDADEIAHADGGIFPWNGVFPAKQAGALNDAQGEIVFQCCTDTESDPWPGSPVCPAAS